MSNEFINPYTFIPVNDGKKQEYGSRFEGGLLSGKISCTLRTKTQIAVCDDTNEPGTKEFFSIDGKTPVIPGSEIRGVIRSIYEALTDSCLSSVNAENDDYFSSRMNKTKPGLLVKENGRYVLYEAKRYADNSKEWIIEDDKTGDEVIFEPYEKEGRKGAKLSYIKCIGDEEYCFNKGYIHKVDSFSNGKNHNSVFEKIEGRKPIPISEEAINRLKINLERYEPKLDGIKDDYKNALKNMEEKSAYLPIWYVSENKNYYFAPSQMSRSIYFKKPIDLLIEQNLHKCESKNEICEACSVFGIVNGDGFAVPSRLRFSDAVFDKNSRKDDPLDKIYRLPVLAQPRISSFEFYLSNPNQSNPNKSFGADDDGTRVAGRKYYWHNNKKRISSDSTVGKDNMVSRVRLLKEGTEFKFEIFFDKITEEMLRKLVFAVNLGENDLNGKQCHKLGYGKPIGLGSVKIIADKITVRGFSNGIYSETDMTSIVGDAGNSGLFNNNNVRNVLRVTDFNAVDGALISYPFTNKSTDIFDWFSENRDSFGPGKPSYKQTLPMPLDEKQVLKTFMPKQPKNCGNNRYGNHK